MKKIKMLFLLLLCSRILPAQTEQIPSRHLLISCTKTSSLEFPQIIESVDLGSRDVLAQKVHGMGNILQVKAAKAGFPGTSMTVVTADGKLYPFLVDYTDTPSSLDFKIGGTPTLFEKIAAEKRAVYGVKNRKLGMVLRLLGIYINGSVLYYQIQIQNNSGLSYDIDMIRFFIRDKSLGKRTATQELDQEPLLIYGNTRSVEGQSAQTIVVALKKFTIPDKKLLFVQLLEKNGGRNLRLKIRNASIIRAKKID